MSMMRIVLCSSTGASSGELCFGSHALKNAAVEVLQINDALGARAKSLKKKHNALTGLQA